MTKQHHSLNYMLQATSGKHFMATLLSVLFKRGAGEDLPHTSSILKTTVGTKVSTDASDFL